MIVFDASTLILLARAELLEKFLENFGQPIAIPKEVERECCQAKQSLDVLLIQKAIDQQRVKVAAVKNRKLLKRVLGDFPLGKGEAEAIVLAISEKAALVGIDDKQGINSCRLLGIPFTTAINILIRMHEKGLVEKDEVLIQLEALQKYGRYSGEIVEDARSKLEVGK